MLVMPASHGVMVFVTVKGNYAVFKRVNDSVNTWRNTIWVTQRSVFVRLRVLYLRLSYLRKRHLYLPM